MLKVLGAVSALTLVLAPLSAQDSGSDASPYGLDASEPVNLAELRCWDVVTLSEDDRAFAMVLIYGYAQGQTGSAQFSPRDVQVAVVNTMMECVDKPDEMVLDILKTHIRS